MTTAFQRSLIDATTAPYRSAGRFAWHFARGKLGGDPAFVGLLERGLIPDAGRLIDLGCGQGLLAAWLRTARSCYESGDWRSDWPAPPKLGSIWGLELMPRDIARARAALGDRAEFVEGDIRHAEFGKANVAVIMDVLHYIDYPEQDEVLRRVRAALLPGGVFITRVGDASGGLPFRLSNWVNRAAAFVRGHRPSRLYYRPMGDWKAALEGLGFRVDTMPMCRGTPFDNVMLVARLD